MAWPAQGVGRAVHQFPGAVQCIKVPAGADRAPESASR